MSRMSNSETVRLYDSGKKRSGCIDRYTLVFLYQRNMEKRMGIRGWAIGCSYSHGDQIIIADSSEIPIGAAINSESFHLGKRISLMDVHPAFASWIAEARNRWREWCRTGKDEDWLQFRQFLGK